MEAVARTVIGPQKCQRSPEELDFIPGTIFKLKTKIDIYFMSRGNIEKAK